MHWDVPLALNAFYGAFTSPDIVDDYVKLVSIIVPECLFDRLYLFPVMLRQYSLHIRVASRDGTRLTSRVYTVVNWLGHPLVRSLLQLKHHLLHFVDSTVVPGLDANSILYRCTYYVCKYFCLNGLLCTMLSTSHIVLAHAGAVKAFREMGIPGQIAYKNDGEV